MYTPAEMPSKSDAPAAKQRAVVYARMSTDHQQYSTENQCDVINEYAAKHGLDIARVYADEGKSGLRIDGRDSLKRLIDDVQQPRRDFDAILVYDVSRWGRFQDADESAYYEYICRRAGVDVAYCAEQFLNDGSPVSTIVKGVKRAMAGEYSRELSAKVFKGQCRLIQLGFRQGGPAGYGLRRVLVDQHGAVKGELTRGEHKSIQTDRVILTPGPPDEVHIVRRIYMRFVHERMSEADIAAMLNAEGIASDIGRPWTRSTVRQVLTNEKYIGNNVYNRISFKLKKKRVRNTPDMYIRAAGAFEPVVDVGLFTDAQQIMQARARRYSDDDLIGLLGQMLQRHGRLSALIIDECDEAPSSSVYRSRFGSLIRAYRMVGYAPEHDYAFIEINRLLRDLHPQVLEQIVTEMRQHGALVERDGVTDLLTINSEFTVSVVIARCHESWIVRMEQALRPDVTVAVRMASDNTSVLDYYLMPATDVSGGQVRLNEANGLLFDSYRHDSLDFLASMARRISLMEVA
jgi:DNA invertase Pin-like site-specific DNA recombinase